MPALDGIRGLAILLVLYWHYIAVPNAAAGPGTLGSFLYRAGFLTWSGVDLFFVLSGFLIGGILIDAKNSPTYFRTFYIRRSFRILPLYILLCVLGLLPVVASPLLQGILGHPMPWWVYATFTQNHWLVHHTSDGYMGQTWSLAVEEQFYLTLPFIIRFVTRRRLPLVVGGLAIASVVARSLLYLHFGSQWGLSAYTFMFCRADALMCGVLGALAVRDSRVRRLLTENAWKLRAAVAVFGCGVAVLLLKGWTMLTRPMSTLGYTCTALFYVSLLLLAVTRPQGWWARALRLRPLMALGNLAYCLYLVHFATFSAASYLIRGRVRVSGPDFAAAGIGFVAALVIAQLSWRLLESTMIHLGHRYAYQDEPRTAMLSLSSRAPDSTTESFGGPGLS